jgi:hypothetical protein
MTDNLLAILVLIYFVIAWRSLNYLINAMGLTFFTSFNGFIQLLVFKFILAGAFGIIIIPIALIHKAVTR